jgi:hypothetical protein
MAEKEMSDMMYHQQMVCSVKCGGRIMREQKEVVLLPFGSDYSLLFKNLRNTRAAVGVSIDGEDVLSGSKLCINPNETYELERFIIDGNLSNGPKFRFIEKTGKVSEHRGDRVDDGIIRVTYAFELKSNPILKFNTPDSFYNYSGTGNVMRGGNQFGDVFDGMKGGGGDRYTYSSNVASRGVTGQSVRTSVVPDSLDDPVAESDVGITTKGSESGQSFTRTTMGMVGEEHVIVLYLRGVNDSGKLIVEPVDVKRKNRCGTCGQINHSNQKFCGGCGTNLDW